MLFVGMYLNVPRFLLRSFMRPLHYILLWFVNGRCIRLLMSSTSVASLLTFCFSGQHRMFQFIFLELFMCSYDDVTRMKVINKLCDL